ncbi:hypothetical protein GCM10009682_31410 [Luedemannella flava]|uniref:Uncharacterized protein n=1 Tax=Luedemannella flava TaxID=349316 RepID=A0ABN2M2D9_9ACTN
MVALENPLFSHAVNAPDGVNMMANTTVLGLGIPLTPVTLLLGPLVTYRVLAVLALAGTAWAWYFGLLARTFLAGSAIAVGVSVALLAYPLWFHFLGPQHYRGLPFSPDPYYTDLAAVAAYARESWFGNPVDAAALAHNAAEENTFYGWPVQDVLVWLPTGGIS